MVCTVVGGAWVDGGADPFFLSFLFALAFLLCFLLWRALVTLLLINEFGSSPVNVKNNI
jgi:hypothetical protein